MPKGRHSRALSALIYTGTFALPPDRIAYPVVTPDDAGAEGNAAEAIREFELCGRLFRDQLGLEPSPQLAELVANLTN